MGSRLLPRRHLLAGCLTLGAPLSWSARAEATLARAVTVPELVRSSARVVRGTAVERYSTWETVAGRRRITTHTRLLVAEDLRVSFPDEPEIWVSTWGGRVGEVAQIAHGEAALRLEEPAVLFLSAEREGKRRVTAMAQGHFPLERRDGELVLRRSPEIAELVDRRKNAAVELLAGRRLTEAARLIREVPR